MFGKIDLTSRRPLPPSLAVTVIVLALIQESKTHAEAKGLAEDACTTGRVFDLIRQAALATPTPSASTEGAE